MEIEWQSKGGSNMDHYTVLGGYGCGKYTTCVSMCEWLRNNDFGVDVLCCSVSRNMLKIYHENRSKMAMAYTLIMLSQAQNHEDRILRREKLSQYSQDKVTSIMNMMESLRLDVGRDDTRKRVVLQICSTLSVMADIMWHFVCSLYSGADLSLLIASMGMFIGNIEKCIPTSYKSRVVLFNVPIERTIATHKAVHQGKSFNPLSEEELGIMEDILFYICIMKLCIKGETPVYVLNMEDLQNADGFQSVIYREDIDTVSGEKAYNKLQDSFPASVEFTQQELLPYECQPAKVYSTHTLKDMLVFYQIIDREAKGGNFNPSTANISRESAAMRETMSEYKVLKDKIIVEFHIEDFKRLVNNKEAKKKMDMLKVQSYRHEMRYVLLWHLGVGNRVRIVT